MLSMVGVCIAQSRISLFFCYILTIKLRHGIPFEQVLGLSLGSWSLTGMAQVQS